MRATAEIKKVIESRLKNYVSRDKTGIRREMLKLFLKRQANHRRGYVGYKRKYQKTDTWASFINSDKTRAIFMRAGKVFQPFPY